MRWTYRLFYLVLAASLGAYLYWSLAGSAAHRRACCLPPPIADAQRTQSSFVALLFPRLSKETDGGSMGRADFARLLEGLKALGYVSLSADDVRAFYLRGRPLPPRGVLLALDRDDPASVGEADAVLARLRLRATVFLIEAGRRTGLYKRHWLSRHALTQMRDGGSWDFGVAVSTYEGAAPGRFELQGSSVAFAFVESKTGFNDDRADPRALNILRLRPSWPPQEALLMIHSEQPRSAEFVDEFGGPGLNRQWMTGWGAVAANHGRLVLVPSPRQTGASAFLSGTDSWRDFALELGLERFNRGFWAYVRYKDADHYLRLGAVDGYWILQQKTGPGALPALLGSAPIRPRDLPARLRLVVKGDSALLYVNNALVLGKAVRLDPGVDRGRVQLAVYAPELRKAVAVLRYVRARPLGTRWLEVETARVSAPEVLDRLREQVVEAAALSPRWLKADADGTLHSAGGERDVLWSFAGYYHCRLVPLADLTGWRVSRDRGVSDALAAALAAQAKALQADGLNILLPADARKADRLVASLRVRLHAQNQELWLTWSGARAPGLSAKADGVLEPGVRPGPGLRLLERHAAPLEAKGERLHPEVR